MRMCDDGQTVNQWGKRWLAVAMLMAVVAMAMAQPAAAQMDAEPPRRADVDEPERAQAEEPVALPLVRAVMFSSGVGYFEHAGTVTGDTTVRLAFQRDQINDVLKSLVVMDAGGGTVTRASYATKDPLERTLTSFAVDLSGSPTLPALLGQLRGSVVTVHAPEPITGRIVSIEARQQVHDDVRTVEHLLTLATDDGLRTVTLENVGRVQLEDDQLQSELNQALMTLGDSHDIDRRPVDLRFEGEGEREVRVGYLIETPVWKSSYRLDLSDVEPGDVDGEAGDDADADEGDAMLQGWAITENMTETDWQDIELSLVSGQPISFIQDLYTPLYFDRPVVALPTHARLTPRIYGEGMATGEDVAQLRAQNGRRAGRAGEAREQAAGLMRQRMMESADGVAADADMAYAPQARLDDSVQARAAAGSVGELFRYTLDHPVTLPRQRSAMLPIVSDRIEAEKLSIYNLREDNDHPRQGVQLTNTTDLNLLAGPVTVLDGGMYAGDALIDSLSPGDTRLLDYAVDLSVTVDDSASSSQRILSGRLVRGVLHLTRRQEYTQTYRIKNDADERRTLVIEHPYNNSRELIEPEEPTERTAEWYRFRVPVEANTTGEFEVKEQRIYSQSIAIIDMPLNDIVAYARTGAIDDDVRDALEQAAEMKHELDGLRETLADRENELNEITSGQERLRRNINTVGRDSQLGQRYLSTLSEQEDRIEELQVEIADLREEIETKRNELADYLQSLDVQ